MIKKIFYFVFRSWKIRFRDLFRIGLLCYIIQKGFLRSNDVAIFWAHFTKIFKNQIWQWIDSNCDYLDKFNFQNNFFLEIKCRAKHIFFFTFQQINGFRLKVLKSFEMRNSLLSLSLVPNLSFAFQTFRFEIWNRPAVYFDSRS